jgi:YHS domain-containing protein
MTASLISSSRRYLTIAMLASAGLMALAPHGAFAYDEKSTSAINVDSKGVAVKGYDVVAYFTAAQPTQGQAEFHAAFNGATYWFSSAADRDAFKQKPARFIPQFGGFCAMGVALDKKLDGDPTAWRIVDDKLYLNVNKDVQKKWLEEVPGNLVKAGQSWPVIKNKAPQTL